MKCTFFVHNAITAGNPVSGEPVFVCKICAASEMTPETAGKGKGERAFEN